MRALSMSALGAFLAAFSASMYAGEESPDRDDVLLVIRSAPPQKIASVLKENFPEIDGVPWRKSLLYILFGDPQAFSASAEAAGENVGLVLMSEDDDIVPILVGQFSPSDRDFLAEAGYSISSYEGWTFATPKSDDPETPGADRQKILELVQHPRDYLVEIETSGGAIGSLVARSQIVSIMKQADALDEFIPELLGGIDLVIGELKSIRALKAGLQFEEENVVLHLQIVAESDSPVAELFNADHSASLSIAEWIDPDAPLLFLHGFNSKAISNYAETVVAGIEGRRGEALATSTEPWRDVLRLYSAQGNESSAGTLRFRGFEPESVQLSRTGMNEEEFAALLRAKEAWFGLDAVVEAVAGHSVYRLGHCADNTEETETLYLARIGNHLLLGDDRDRFIELADRVARDTKPEASAAEHFREDPDLAFQFVIVSAFLFNLLSSHLQMEAPESAKSVPQIRGDLRFGEASARGRIEIPLALLSLAHAQLEAAAHLVSEEDIHFSTP